MDSEELFECEASPPANIYFQCRTLNTNDFAVLVNEIIRNENIEDGATVCFQVFYSIMAESIHNKVLEEDFFHLHTVAKCVKRLKEAHKFDSLIFVSCLLDEFLTLPLEIVWWLHKNEIMYFSQYCPLLNPWDLANSLLKILQMKKQHKIFVVQEIVQDLITELLRGCYRPKLGVCRLYVSKTWSLYCSEVLNCITEVVLLSTFSDSTEPFVNILPFVRNSQKFLPSIMIKRFYTNVLNKIVTHHAAEFDLHSSYVYQQLWTSDKINKNLLLLYEEVFTKYCDMKTISDIIEEHEEKINWKFTLAAVGVCVKKCPTGNKDVKDTVLCLTVSLIRTNAILKDFVFYLWKNPDVTEKWNETIPWADQKYTGKELVCENHLKNDDIVKEWTVLGGITNVHTD